jgi:hypothetical protein
MKTRVVPSSEITSKSLRAEDYVSAPKKPQKGRSKGRGIPCSVYFFPEEYELLTALAKSFNETPAQLIRRLVHEKVDECAAGELKHCEGWKRSERSRGYLMALRASIEEYLEKM